MIVDWLKQHWFIFTALVAGGVAWGQTVNKVSELERRIEEKTIKEQKVDSIAEGQSRLDERTQMMQQEQREQRQLLLEILNSQRSIAKQQVPRK